MESGLIFFMMSEGLTGFWQHPGACIQTLLTNHTFWVLAHGHNTCLPMRLYSSLLCVGSKGLSDDAKMDLTGALVEENPTEKKKKRKKWGSWGYSYILTSGFNSRSCPYHSKSISTRNMWCCLICCSSPNLHNGHGCVEKAPPPQNQQKKTSFGY